MSKNLDKSTDSSLILGVVHSDTKCFEALFQRYYDRSYSYAIALLRDAAAAQDVVQNVFMKIWIGRKNLDPQKVFKNYLAASIRNETLNYLRQKSVSQRQDLSEASSHSVPEVAYKEKDSLALMLQQLPERRRQVVRMKYEMGMSVKEIASSLGLSEKTVERHLFLARIDIRKYIS